MNTTVMTTDETVGHLDADIEIVISFKSKRDVPFDEIADIIRDLKTHMTTPRAKRITMERILPSSGPPIWFDYIVAFDVVAVPSHLDMFKMCRILARRDFENILIRLESGWTYWE